MVDQKSKGRGAKSSDDEDDSSARLTAEDAWLFPLVRLFIHSVPCARSDLRASSWSMTARFGAARWPVPGGQIPWEGVDQLAHVTLFWPRWTVQCTPCQSSHLLAQVSRHSLLSHPSP